MTSRLFAALGLAAFAFPILFANAAEVSPDALPSCKAAPGITPPVAQPSESAAKYFPAISQVLGEEGDVLLEFTLNTNGKVSDLKIGKSSGFPRLDDAALKVGAQWRFTPAKRDGESFVCAHKAIVRWAIKDGHPSPDRMIVPEANSWPSGTREDGLEGVTAVLAIVAPDGSVKTQVVQSSDSRALDKDAVARVLARPDVKPDMWDGKPVGARFTFYVIWSLTPVTLPAKSAPQASVAPSAN